MTALIIVLAVLLLLALLRFGVHLEFCEEGLFIKATLGFVKVQVYPLRKKSADKEKKKKSGKKKKKKKDKDNKKPGLAADFPVILKAIKKVFSRFRRRLLVKKLVLYYTAAGEDAYKTAMSFGLASAAFDSIIPALEALFRIRKRDVRESVNFMDTKARIYFKIIISIAVWEIFYIAAAMLPVALKRAGKNQTKRKENEHGKASDRRADGNNDAEDSGNGRR